MQLLKDHRFHALLLGALLAFTSYRDLQGEPLQKPLLQAYVAIGVVAVLYHGYELTKKN